MPYDLAICSGYHCLHFGCHLSLLLFRSNPLWLETEGGIPDDWPDSISLLGGGAAREYEAQVKQKFLSDAQSVLTL